MRLVQVSFYHISTCYFMLGEVRKGYESLSQVRPCLARLCHAKNG
jgi:hypothetical protein